ncbi:L-lactate MFS transporter [Halarcobacter anaerophilus]|jgi:OFA family oxalate/formate antiporter-like MFS transporter|uniref:MFS transporter n=1 Tax=Halarcobacter anaerophilus TaxID=877500 RepID=A0A4Q0Y6M8_9BACT|nr:OFA family MFS transporter [Halarcobacter anaerophilus]QDF29279.1 major facilitator superfamily transporter [Halarcobacter anaerophilus]RXJ64529.1 MFS transporter [Halarcobacter anaerophilus]
MIEKNRWLMALAAVGVHICIGSVYAWSVYVKPIQEKLSWSLTDVTISFSIAIFFLGLSAALMGKFVEKNGPRVSAIIAASLFGLGTIGSGLAILMESKMLLYFFYGVLGGCGLGIGYISPVSTLVKWFPDKRGMATGLAIMGFGFASAIWGPTIKILIESVGISNTFFILGASYFVIMFLSALYLQKPQEGYMPEKFKKKVKEGKKKIKKDLQNLTLKEAVKTPRFYGLWIMLFINITCGIAIIGVASPLLQEVMGVSAIAAAAAVGLMGIFNGAGRLVWASISDIITRPAVYVIFFITQIVAFYMLPSISEIVVFQVVLYFIMTCYGGGFAAIPAYIGDIFGTKELGAIHGYILTAWAAAGLVGPLIISIVKDITGSYAQTLYVFAGFFIIALIVSLLMVFNIKKIKKQTV